VSDLNALVGRKIGLEPERFAADVEENGEYDCVVRELWPNFKHDIAAAWLLVEWMHGQGWTFSLWFGRLACAKFLLADNDVYTAEHENPATAITRAFCAANGIAVEQSEEAHRP